MSKHRLKNPPTCQLCAAPITHATHRVYVGGAVQHKPGMCRSRQLEARAVTLDEMAEAMKLKTFAPRGEAIRDSSMIYEGGGGR